MSSITRSVLGAALLLTSASAAMAQSATGPVVAYQGAATTTTAAPTNAPVANNAPVAGQVTTYNSAPVVAQAPKPAPSAVADTSDTYGGHDPNSLAGARAFWQSLNPY